MSEEKVLSYSEAIELAKDKFCRFPLIPVRGIPLMSYIANNWDSVWNFCPDSSDLLIATYPKAGTTWTQEIVDLLLHNGDAEACKRAPTPVRSPFLEIFSPPPIASGLDLLKTMDPPRMIKTHLPIQLVPPAFWEKKCKVIYVARNAKDNIVSYYHFDCMNKTQPEPGPWDGYIRKFMQGERCHVMFDAFKTADVFRRRDLPVWFETRQEGRTFGKHCWKVAWGSWYNHVTGYWKERESKNILYLFYEDMKENPRREVERIMRYLDLSVSDEVLSRIVELTSFEKMKENPMANYSCIPAPIFDQSVSRFMRKGEVGDWRNHFTPEQSKMFDEDYEKQMKDINIPFRTCI